MVKVSIIVPVYNAGNKLKKCIKSILSQTFKDIEVILVNDGSTDNSLDICNKYAEKDKRIKIINKKNEGCIAARKTGIQSAKSDYIMFVDADDWVDKEMVEILYNELIQNKCDITVCNIYKVLGDKAIIKRENNSKYYKEDRVYEGQEINDKLTEAYLHGHPFSANLVAKLYKKELLEKNCNYLNKIEFLGEDLYYNLEIFLKINKVKIIKRPMYYYRAGGSTSKYMSYHFNDIVNGYDIQKEVIEKYYQDSRQKRYNGISIMLLNSLKTSLSNIMNSGLSSNDVKKEILKYTKDSRINEAIQNEGSKKYFNIRFLEAIETSDVDYLYNMGVEINKRIKKRGKLVNFLAKLNL